jgi:serine/threonine protein kinase
MTDQNAPTRRERGGLVPADLAATPASGAVVRATTTPDTVGRFVIECELGSGGMGVVYAAFDPTLDRRVAVKLLREDLPSHEHNERAQARLAREARAMARLQHSNVVTVYEVGIHDGHVFLVMEYVAGGTLRTWLNQRHAGTGPSWQRVLAVFTAAGRGLAAAHAAGLVHRDFKPDNVLLAEIERLGESRDRDPGRVLVSDFGIANVYGDDLTSSGPGEPPRQLAVTRTGATLGTPLYMSPEQHLGRAIDARTDQFSFCASLYEALYGVAPFGKDDITSIAVNAIDGVLTPPPADHQVPAYVHAAMVRGLRPAPGDRFPTMSALLEALAPPAPRRWPRYAIAGGAAVAAATAIIILATRPPAAVTTRRAKPTCDCEMFAVAPPPGGARHRHPRRRRRAVAHARARAR